MRVLFLITDLGKGGAERYLIDLCAELIKYKDIDFIIGSLYGANQYSDYTKDFNIVKLEYSTFSFFGKNENVAYKKLLETYKPDIVHTHRYLGEFLSSYYVDKNIKYICHGHDNMEQLDNFRFSWIFNKRKIINALEKMYLCRTKYNKAQTWILANSKDTYEYYKKVMPSKVTENVVLMYCGFDYARFATPKKKDNADPTKLKIINVSSFAEKKNQIFIVDIAQELKKRNVDFEVKLIGDGVCFSKVQEAVREKGLENHVKFYGLQMYVEQLYAESDIYLHSAYYEPLGLVLLEAMASGLPVVTLDGRGNRDLIEQGQNGYMIYEQNPKLFADKIMEIWNDKEKYQRMSDYGREFAKQFDMKVYAEKMVDFYKSL